MCCGKPGMVGLDPGNNASPLGGCYKLASVANRKVGGWDTRWKNLIYKHGTHTIHGNGIFTYMNG